MSSLLEASKTWSGRSGRGDKTPAVAYSKAFLKRTWSQERRRTLRSLIFQGPVTHENSNRTFGPWAVEALDEMFEGDRVASRRRQILTERVEPQDRVLLEGFVAESPEGQEVLAELLDY